MISSPCVVPCLPDPQKMWKVFLLYIYIGTKCLITSEIDNHIIIIIVFGKPCMH